MCPPDGGDPAVRPPPTIGSMDAMFDVLAGGASPSGDFGPVRRPGPGFDDMALAVRTRIEESFDVDLNVAADVPEAIESIAAGMWSTGWTEMDANTAVLPHDLGLVLTVALHVTLGGSILTRGDDQWIHCSIWWEDRRLEAFPFHKVLKRLTEQDGESLTYFDRSLRARLGDGI